jgi:histidine triad (HIT) family protein
MAHCLFCEIAAKRVPARIVHEDDDTLAFEDIAPQAPHHLLVIPKRHIATANDLADEDVPLAGKLLAVAARIAKARGFDGPGWRAVVNVNRDACQSVFHLHLHLLAGRGFGWPPG